MKKICSPSEIVHVSCRKSIQTIVYLEFSSTPICISIINTYTTILPTVVVSSHTNTYISILPSHHLTPAPRFFYAREEDKRPSDVSSSVACVLLVPMGIYYDSLLHFYRCIYTHTHTTHKETCICCSAFYLHFLARILQYSYITKFSRYLLRKNNLNFTLAEMNFKKEKKNLFAKSRI